MKLVATGKSSTTSSLLAMIGATALWGASGGAIAGVHANGYTSAAVVELTTGLVLTSLALMRGDGLGGVVKSLRKRLLLLAFIEAGNVVCYYVALQKAPLSPVMAMHLTAPVLLAVRGMLKRQRSVSVRGLVSLTLVFGALLLIGLSDSGESGHRGLFVGMVLSLASAACIALFITVVRGVANDVPPIPAAGLQMLCSGLLLSPALLRLNGHAGSLPGLLMIAVILFAPACCLSWRAMKGLDPVLAGNIGLAEPFFGAPAAFVLYNTKPSAADVAAVALVLGATYLELTTVTSSARVRQRQPPPPFMNSLIGD